MEAGDPSSKSRTPKGKASKGKILDMAEKVFMEKGFVSASLKDVFKGMGISAGALYHHFPTKQSLLAGIAERSLEKLFAEMEFWLADDTLTPGQKLDRFFDAYDDRRRLKGMMDFVQMGLAREDRDMHELIVQMGLGPISDHLTPLIEQGNASGEFNAPDAKATAVVITMLILEYFHRTARIDKMLPDRKFSETLRESCNRLLMRDTSA
ncbi:MAG: TetR/AcrR family transcriptional regulator [Verrucomicrobiota bacterium]